MKDKSVPYPIMSLKSEVLKKVNRYKSILFYVNFPLIVGIPIVLEGGFLSGMEEAKFDKTYLLLQAADFMLCFNSIFIYSTIKKMASAIHYLPEEHKLVITQYRSKMLGEVKVEIDPKDLIKCKRQTMNPLVGYKNVTDNNDTFITESTAVWNDR